MESEIGRKLSVDVGEAVKKEAVVPPRQKRRKLPDDFVEVQILEAKPNPMFSEAQRQSVRFLRYSRHVPCAECGKKKRLLWTSTFTFIAHHFGALVMTQSGKSHPPLTPVCTDHPMSPALDALLEANHADEAEPRRAPSGSGSARGGGDRR
jgi:hypothetical protein